MMSCQQVYAFLDDFIDGRLDTLTRVNFGLHLLICAACRNYLATYRAAIGAAQGAEKADAPDAAVPEDLIQAILASRGGLKEQEIK